uniref:ATP-dependent RNA helicase n=1 Tax=Ditylenchus dipsaci TaxID=166011 RepID=A0A915EMY2_9BILA
MPPPAKKRIKLSKDPERRRNYEGYSRNGIFCADTHPKKVIPIALDKGLDVLGAAETGSGKTMAFAIPIFEKWLRQMREIKKEESVNSLFALIVTPTRELAMQIHNEIKLLTKFAVEPHLRSIALVGGLSQQKQERMLKSKPQVIVATPGRLWSIMDMGEEHLDDLSGLKVLVVDEIDRMLEKGHFEELDKIVQRINCYAEEDRSYMVKDHLQTLIFSATLTFTHEPIQRADGSKTSAQTPAMKIRKLMDAMCLRKKHQTVDLTKATSTPQSLVECRMNCADLQQKDANLYYVLNRYKGRTLVFANSIDATRRLYGLLKSFSFSLLRRCFMPRCKNRKDLKILKNSLPRIILFAGYRHSRKRIRYQKRGRCDSLPSSQDDRRLRPQERKNCPRFQEWSLCSTGRSVGCSGIDTLEIDSPKLFEACGHRVSLAAKAESAEFRLKKVSSRKEWFKKAAEEMDIILDDSLIGDGDDEEINPEVVNLRRQKKKSEMSLASALKQSLPFAHSRPKEVPEILKKK